MHIDLGLDFYLNAYSVLFSFCADSDFEILIWLMMIHIPANRIKKTKIVGLLLLLPFIFRVF
jgi:hypothetical protein